MTIVPNTAVETPLIKVPYERLKTVVRERKCALEGVNNIVSTIANYAADGSGTTANQIECLDEIMSSLAGLKRKLDETSCQELQQVQKCRSRVEHLNALALSAKEGVGVTRKSQLNRILVDYMLRRGYYDSAQRLVESSQLQNLVDVDIFVESKQIIEALREHRCDEALEWCAQNSSRLRKLKSKLEFELRRAEFLELVRQEKTIEAIAYSRKYLAPWASSHMKELQQAMATLIFKDNSSDSPYKGLFDASQWDKIVDLFREENFRLNFLTLDPLLTIHLQAGLSALKTPYCYREGCNVEDPLHLQSFRRLAEGLPFSKHIHSKLVCHITKEIMNEDNPPMVLPNGHVYSSKAMEDMARKNGGKIVCPRTGYECSLHQLSKAYIS